MGMRKIHSGQGGRIQNGDPFNWMLKTMATDRSKGTLSPDLNSTDMSRHAIVLLWRKLGYKTIPQKALDMLKERIEDLDL